MANIQGMAAKETLGERLQRLRASAGLTQTQVADMANVPISSLRNWETDHREPGFRAAVQLAKALGVAVEVLAETTPKDEADKVPRPAGPTRKPAVEEPKKPRRRRGKEKS